MGQVHAPAVRHQRAFGFAYATRIYWWQQVNPADLIQSNEAAFDYVVCVLDEPMGDLTGWLGSRGYSTDWDGEPYWAHVGYPNDVGGGDRPVYHGPGTMDSTVTESSGGRDSFRVMHRNDVIPGQSGGPYFGWWDGEPWPRVVASQSAENWGSTPGPNAAGGGNPSPVAHQPRPQRGALTRGVPGNRARWSGSSRAGPMSMHTVGGRPVP